MDVGLAILEHLFDNGPIGLNYDLKPFVQKLNIDRQHLIDVLSGLENDGYIKGDSRWGNLFIKKGNKYIFEIHDPELFLNFKLTPDGKNYCIERKRLKSGNENQIVNKINVKKNYGNINQGSTTSYVNESKAFSNPLNWWKKYPLIVALVVIGTVAIALASFTSVMSI